MLIDEELGQSLRAFLKALFALAEPSPPPPAVYTATVWWEQPQPKKERK